MGLTYIYKEIKNNFKDLRWWYYQFTNHFISKFYTLVRNKGEYILKKDWDYMIILDACRYDTFEKYYSLYGFKGSLTKMISRGSATREFLKENFLGKFLKDIVYVNASSHVTSMLGNTFFKTIDVWSGYWSETENTVKPDNVVKYTVMAKKSYPDKRMIIHFMQPHAPFIGKTREKGNFWQVALKHGKKRAMEVYEANLEHVLPYVKKLCCELDGKIVITGDHGDSCGEKALGFIPIYSHPYGLHINTLIEVPWFEVKNDT